MNDNEPDLPEFPEALLSTSFTGDPIATDGLQKMCLTFCISWWNGMRWVPWRSMVFCGISPEGIRQEVDLLIRALAAMGFQARAVQGDCPGA